VTIERFLVGSVEPLGEREVGVCAASSELARDGHVLVVEGLSLDNYKRNPVVLVNHNPDALPIGACTALGVQNGDLYARIQFAPLGTSTIADECCALAKSGLLRGVSIGFDVLDAEPLDPRQGARGGLRITQSELYEISLVSVPADVNAAVIARSFTARPSAATMMRALRPLLPGAIERALSSVRPAACKPQASMTPAEQWERDRQRTMTAWALGQAAETERRAIADGYSYEQRQADLRALSGQITH
jgi:HK97 family phage prohead protease